MLAATASIAGIWVLWLDRPIRDCESRWAKFRRFGSLQEFFQIGLTLSGQEIKRPNQKCNRIMHASAASFALPVNLRGLLTGAVSRLP
jgi:hypothetical protein